MKLRISAAEWKIMDLLWQEPRTLMELVSILAVSEEWSKSTVTTMVRRLESKQILRYEQNGRTKIFYAAIARNEAAAEQTSSFLQRTYNGSLGSMVSGMVERNDLTRQDIEELYAILRRAEEALK